MNFKQTVDKMSRLQSEAGKLTERLAEIVGEVEVAKGATSDFLAKCANAGLDKVAICVSHEIVPCSTSFPFGAHSSVFGIGPASVERTGTWPPIWGVVESVEGYAGGCGNSDQHQVSAQAQKELLHGTYELRDGVWFRLDD